MKFHKNYDGTQPSYRIDPESFVSPFNYLSPEFENLLRSKYVRLPRYNSVVKRLNTPEIAGYSPKIANH